VGWWDYEVNIIWFTELKMLRVISICGVLDIVSTKLRQVLTASLVIEKSRIRMMVIVFLL
jgi:hypothetical protein